MATLLAGTVFYKGKTLKFFGEDAIVDRDQNHEIPISHLIAQAQQGRYKLEGRMPADFHGKLVSAIKKSKALSAAKAKLLLECIGEKP